MNDHNTSEGAVARLMLTGRDPIDVTGSITFGRDPRPTSPGARTVEIMGDPLVSKSHFAVDIDQDAASPALIITDLGSSNGTFLHDGRGETPVPDQEWVSLPADAEVEFGDQRMKVEMLAPSNVPVDPTPVSPIAPADPWGAGIADDDAVTSIAPVDDASDAIACSNCQRELPAGSKFCDGCGTPTEAAAPAPAPSTAALWSQEVEAAPPVEQAPPVAQPAPPVQPPPPSAQPGPPSDVGGPTFVEPAPADAPSSGGLGLKIGVGLGALVLLGGGAFALTQVLGGDDSPSSGQLVDVPESIDEQWSESVSGRPLGAGIGSNSVYVLTGEFDEDFELTSFATSDGEERWSESLGGEGTFGEFLGEFGDVVVATVCDPECDMVGFDVDSGDEVWTEGIDVGLAQAGNGRIYVDDTNGEGRLLSYDPATGDRLERVSAEFYLFVDDHFLIADGDDVEVLDVDLQPIFGPVEVPEDTRAVAYTGDMLIFAVEDELLFVDEDGDTQMEMSFGVDEIDGIVIDDDGNVVVSTDEGLLSAEPVDGRADERWSQDGRLVLAVAADGGTVIVAVDDESDEATVYDADTGDRRFDIDDYSDSGTTLVPGSNAAVVLMREGFAEEGDVDVIATDWDSGDELWDEGLEGVVVVDNGALLSVESNGDVIYFR